MFNMDDVEDLLHVLNICTRLNLWPLQNSFEAQHILRHRATTWGYEESLTALQYMQYTMSEQQSSTNSGPRDATRSIFSPESGSKLSLLFPADKPNRLRRSIHSNVINQFNKLRRPLRMEMIRTYQSLRNGTAMVCNSLKSLLFGICNSLLSRFASSEAKISKASPMLPLCSFYVAFAILCL